ncbi:MAG: 3-methyl-2-oxobutanoate hydroxymethyltransferase, partial [bacterium]
MGDKIAPITVPDIVKMKREGVKITALTAYDATFARLIDEAGIEIILVGDSLGMVIQGHPNTLPVTLDEAIYHTACCSRGVKRALLVTDMPFMSYQASPEQALINAGRCLKE